MSDEFNKKILTKFRQRLAMDRISYTGDHPNSYRHRTVVAGRLICSKCGNPIEDGEDITSRSNTKLTRYFHTKHFKLVEY